MQMDYVDLHLINSPFFAKSDEGLQTAWKAMEDVKKKGKAKSKGMSNHLKSPLKSTLGTIYTSSSIIQSLPATWLSRVISQTFGTLLSLNTAP